MSRIKGYASGLKWAGIKEFLFEMAADLHLDFTVLDEDKGFLRTTIYYQVDGATKNLAKFSRGLKLAMDQYNNDGEEREEK